MNKSTKLELTWIGKNIRPNLEPRILIENNSKSFHAKFKSSQNDLYSNILIHGDNLLALKALELKYSGKIKCIYIDPPYNTGQAFDHYEDGLEHSIWLSLMHSRIELLRKLLSDDGLIFVQIDDNELAYLTVLMDEIFQRKNRMNIISVKMSEPSGVKMAHANNRLPKLKEFILVYKKEKTPLINIEKVPISDWNEEYKTLLVGVDKEKIERVKSIIESKNRNEEDADECRQILKDAKLESLSSYFKKNKIKKSAQKEWKFNNSWRIIQAVGSSSVFNLAKKRPIIAQDIDAALSSTGIVYLFKTDFSREAKQPRVQILFADMNLMSNPGDFWGDIKTTGGVGQEGGVLFPKSKKPETLIKRIIEMCTKPGDIVLDSFLGSGTTVAVAHKMRRRWIGIELGDHCYTHCIPRMQKVVDGTDQSGISKRVNWDGGGGFRFYELGPSLIKNDKWGNPVINPDFNAEMLSQAMCKLEGFSYNPSDECYWMHGQSSENDFIYVTTQSMTISMLENICNEVGLERSLLICCKAFQCKKLDFPNLTIKKIPKAVLKKCEWGHDDYSLNVANLPAAPPQEFMEFEEKPQKKRVFGKKEMERSLPLDIQGDK